MVARKERKQGTTQREGKRQPRQGLVVKLEKGNGLHVNEWGE